jgi:hypothetical protein
MILGIALFSAVCVGMAVVGFRNLKPPKNHKRRVHAAAA